MRHWEHVLSCEQGNDDGDDFVATMKMERRMKMKNRKRFGRCFFDNELLCVIVICSLICHVTQYLGVGLGGPPCCLSCFACDGGDSGKLLCAIVSHIGPHPD